MHGNDKFRAIESTALLCVGKIPYTTQNLIRQPCAFEYLLRNVAYVTVSGLFRTKCFLYQVMGVYIPDMTPFTTSDLSKSEANLVTSSGCSGGTRMGPDAPGGGLAGLGSGTGAVVSTEIPSNRGNGPAIVG